VTPFAVPYALDLHAALPTVPIEMGALVDSQRAAG
jgi:hypothetical protein